MSPHDAARRAALAQKMRARLKRTGVTAKGHKLWSPEENRLVAELYPDYEALQRALPGRSYYAIRAHARESGIATGRHIWTCVEFSKLKRLYPISTREELEAAFPYLQPSKIEAQVRRLGLTKRRRGFKSTGNPFVDSIRERAFALRYSMVDLDAIAGSKKYFQKAGWQTGNVNHKALCRAAEAMGGTISVEWQD